MVTDRSRYAGVTRLRAGLLLSRYVLRTVADSTSVTTLDHRDRQYLTCLSCHPLTVDTFRVKEGILYIPDVPDTGKDPLESFVVSRVSF